MLTGNAHVVNPVPCNRKVERCIDYLRIGRVGFLFARNSKQGFSYLVWVRYSQDT
nr:MAG TPA: hypothetical protein [Caudoviricetes sp.]